MRKYLFLLVLGALFLTGNAIAGDVQIRGSYSQGFIKTMMFNYLTEDSRDGTFQFNELNASVSTPVTDAFHVGFGLASRNLGDLYNNKMTLNWAYGDYRFKDYMGVRMGRMKTPLGLFNETREMDMFRTGILLPGPYPEAYRDFWSYLDGAGVYGTIPVPYFGNLLYQANFGTQDIPADAGTAKFVDERLRALKGKSYKATPLHEMFVVDLKWETPVPGLMLGGSYYDLGTVEALTALSHPLLGDFNGTLFLDDLLVVIYSLKYMYQDFTFISEYMTFEMKNTVMTESGVKLVNAKEVFLESWYFSPAYRFTDWFEVGGYYSEFYPTKYARDKEYLKDICLSLRFDVNANWVIKLEGHKMKGVGYVVQGDNLDKNWSGTDYSDKEWTMFAAKATCYF